MSQVQVVTSALSLGRELWRYGESDLAGRACGMTPEDVLTVGGRAGVLMTTGEEARLWPDGPRNAALMLAVVEFLEGAARPCRRGRRLPESDLPDHLQATEEQRWAAAAEVARVNDQRNAGR